MWPHLEEVPEPNKRESPFSHPFGVPIHSKLIAGVLRFLSATPILIIHGRASLFYRFGIVRGPGFMIRIVMLSAANGLSPVRQPIDYC